MLYLLDANILITANSSYYPIDQVPEFWSWLRYQGAAGRVKIPLEIMEEVREGRKDPLIDWISQHENADALLFDEIVDAVLVQRVVSIGYADDLTDDEVEKIGRDPFLIAYALFNPSERCIVTTEVSRPSAQRQNRKIPMYAVRSACNVAGRSFSTEILDFTRAGGSVAVSRLENSIELSRTAVSCCVSHR